MTAVTMIFEMTHNFDIVMPMIITVAVEYWCATRPFAREHLHDKLVSRRHFFRRRCTRTCSLCIRLVT